MDASRGMHWHLDIRVDDPAWLAQAGMRVIATLRDTALWQHLQRMQAHGGKFARLTEPGLVKINDKAARGRGWHLVASEEDPYLVRFSFESDPDVLVLRLVVQDDAWRELAGDLLPLMSTCLAALDHPVLLIRSGISPRFEPDLPWDEVPDRVRAPYLRFENVIDVFDQRMTQHLDEEPASVLAKILAAPAPDDVTRVRDGEYVLLHWANGFLDEDALADARMRHERWLHGLVRAVRAERADG